MKQLIVFLQSSAVTSGFLTFFNMSCLGVILQVMERDGMSTLQNGAVAYRYSQSCITYLPGWFPVAFPAVFIFWVFFYGRSSLTAEAFLWPQSLASFWCRLHMCGLQNATGLLLLSRSTLVGDLTQPLPFRWPTGIPFVCIIHLKAAFAYLHYVHAPALINLLYPRTVRIMWVCGMITSKKSQKSESQNLIDNGYNNN